MTADVRLAGGEDIVTLVGLMERFHAESGYALDRKEAARSFERLLETSEHGAAWIAHVETEAAGYVVLTLRGHSMEFGGPDGFIDDFYVEPRLRRRGIGRSLLEALVAECRRKGVRALHVEVGSSNDAAVALYEAFGMRADDRLLLSTTF